MKNLLSYLTFWIILGGGNILSAQENSALQKAVSEYADITTALVADDFLKAKKEIPALEQAWQILLLKVKISGCLRRLLTFSPRQTKSKYNVKLSLP